jgi:hypothetical protein
VWTGGTPPPPPPASPPPTSTDPRFARPTVLGNPGLSPAEQRACQLEGFTLLPLTSPFRLTLPLNNPQPPRVLLFGPLVEVGIITKFQGNSMARCRIRSPSRLEHKRGMAMADITMPGGRNFRFGTVNRWLKQVGDHFNTGDSLVEIAFHSDSSSNILPVEVEASEPGILSEIVVPEGVQRLLEQLLPDTIRPPEQDAARVSVRVVLFRLCRRPWWLTLDLDGYRQFSPWHTGAH